jgi:hypothetical protein
LLASFTPASLQDYSTPLRNRLTLLLSQLEKRASTASTLDIGEWISFFAWDFMGDMAFGGGFDLVRDGTDKQGYWKMMTETIRERGTMRNLTIVGKNPRVCPPDQLIASTVYSAYNQTVAWYFLSQTPQRFDPIPKIYCREISSQEGARLGAERSVLLVDERG